QEQRTVFAERDHRLEVFAVADEKHQRLRQNHFVAEISSCEEQAYGREHERQNVALLVPIKAGGNEAPDLVKHKRRGNKQAGHHPKLQIKIEGLGRIDINQF